MGIKQFKDPIYGYIEIDDELVKKIIDTPAFQRLKNIQQTSYTPLFPGAYHNRYVHSIGVFFLGCRAFSAIKQQLQQFIEGTRLEIEDIKEIFEIACLLHDIGHAPFSHTGEFLYHGRDDGQTLYKILKECVDDQAFTKDIDEKYFNEKAAPHEVMSCIIGLKTFGAQYIKDPFSRSLFARCITGFKYRDNSKDSQLLNCVISLLNSSIIDVDRLDYIIRDAQTIGYKNVQVDYERLLNGTRILYNQSKYCVGYHKSAISVIENAVFAHDSEKKWIQNHPSILYEMYILRHSMESISKKMEIAEDTNPLFCYEALTEEGKEVSIALCPEEAPSRLKIKLLADEEIFVLMKMCCTDNFSKEFFARNKRRSAVWKSEAEYKVLFENTIGQDSELILTLENGFIQLENFIYDKFPVPVIDANVSRFIEEENSRLEEQYELKLIKYEDFINAKQSIENQEMWINALKNVSKENDIEFNFVLISAKKFKSNFKDDIKKLRIEFNSISKIYEFERVSTTLAASPPLRPNFFHLYYSSQENETAEGKKHIILNIASALRTCAEAINNRQPNF